MQQYVDAHEERAFLEDVLATMQAITSGSVAQNALTRALADTLVQQAGPYMDTGNAEVLGDDTSALKKVLVQLRESTSPHYCNARFQELLSAVYPESSVTVVQTPTTLSPEQRAAMRTRLAQKYPHAYPSFSVDRSLLGGMRLFIDGTLVDRSWQQTVRTLLNTLTTQ